MLILVLNAGSSSLKFNLMDMDTETSLADGIAERVGMSEGFIRWTIQGQKGRLDLDMNGHRKALAAIMEQLHATVLTGDREVSAVGHRVAHGGPNFGDPELITPSVLAEIEELAFYAPLHNPASASGIRTAQEMFPGVPQVAVFDTAFHHTMPDYAYTYGLPYELTTKLGLRRYGFHGTSHQYVAERTARLVGRPVDQLKIITCHLGNGSSITAVKRGKCVDTSMGLTPLEGVVMGTRCGNVDPGVLTTLMEQEALDAKSLGNLLNKKSGLLGISGVSNDVRDLEKAAAQGHARSRLALQVFVYELKKYLGAYAAALGGLDAVAFSGGIGENSWRIRDEVCSGLGFLGLRLDPEANRSPAPGDRVISASDSAITVLVVHTNEELMVARETVKVLATAHGAS